MCPQLLEKAVQELRDKDNLWFGGRKICVSAEMQGHFNNMLGTRQFEK